jgi:signal transduction histidine kinase/DNA-binding NarL/FixJ family response regulator
LARVLLIEDNPGDVELVRRRLAGVRGVPFHLTTADTLEGGIAAYHAQPSDVVLLDLNLPDSGGLETIDAFRAEVREAPLVVLTGTSDLDTAVQALRRGADDYIGKDHELSGDLLARTIRYSMERRRMVASLETERSTVTLLQDVGAALAAELDREALVQKIIDLATHLVGAAYGAFFYYAHAPGPDAPLQWAVSGLNPEGLGSLGAPSASSLVGATFLDGATLRSDDVRLDPRYGRSVPHYGVPAGHVPVVSYLAAPVVLRNGAVMGGLFFGHPERARFSAEHERLAVGVGGWAAVAMDNARLYEEALHASHARENLLQVVSHDLRNHANTLIVGLQLLRTAVPPEKMRRFESVDRATTAMRRLLEDLVDIAAIEKGVLSVNPSLVEGQSLIFDAQALFVPSIEDRGLAANWDSIEPGIMIWADGGRVLQILGNLVGNAIKFTPPGGTISLTVTTRDTEVELGVDDSGPGLPEADRDRVFDRFFRGSRPRGQGAGLGLAIARALVEAHGGRIGVGSAPSGGARFFFTLPRTEPVSA